LFAYELVVVTAYLVWATIRLWKAGEDQLIHAQDTARRQLRAYVSVEPEGISSYNPPDRVVARVRFHNTGSIFAKDVSTSINCELSDDGERESFPEGNISGNNVIAPRATILRGADESVLKSDIDSARSAAKSAKKQLYLYVWGIARYHDGFEGGRWTRYCHRYNLSAVPEYTIPVENFRYHHRGNQIDDKD